MPTILFLLLLILWMPAAEGQLLRSLQTDFENNKDPLQGTQQLPFFVVKVPSTLLASSTYDDNSTDEYMTCSLLEQVMLMQPGSSCPESDYTTACGCRDASLPRLEISMEAQTSCQICDGTLLTNPNAIVEVPAGYVSQTNIYLSCQTLQQTLASRSELFLQGCKPTFASLFATECGCAFEEQEAG